MENTILTRHRDRLLILVEKAWGTDRIARIHACVDQRLAELHQTPALMDYHWEEYDWLVSFKEPDEDGLSGWFAEVHLSLLALNVQTAVLPELMLLSPRGLTPETAYMLATCHRQTLGRGITGCNLLAVDDHQYELASHLASSGTDDERSACCYFVWASCEMGDRDACRSWSEYWLQHCPTDFDPASFATLPDDVSRVD